MFKIILNVIINIFIDIIIQIFHSKELVSYYSHKNSRLFFSNIKYFKSLIKYFIYFFVCDSYI